MADVNRNAINFRRVFDILAFQRDRYPNSKALNERGSDGAWNVQSIYTIQDRIDTISYWLLNEKCGKGDKIVFIPHAGSIDWMVLDLACQQIGMISVILHPTLTIMEINRIVEETSPRYIICDDYEWYEQQRGLISLPLLYHTAKETTGFFTAFHQEKLLETQLHQIHRYAMDIQEDDIFCILYTSGSTGESKGVMLSHANVMHNIKAILTILPVEPSYRVISFLPFSHIFERVSCYAYLAFGVSIYFSREKESFSNDFKSVRPHCCTSVPRVLEKMYEFVELKSHTYNRIKRKIITWSLHVGEQYTIAGSHSISYSIQLALARLLVLYRWRRALGHQIRFIIVGAAALRPEICRLFSAGGIRIIEAYGMTEMSPIITMNRMEPGLQQWGTVGIPIHGVEIHIDKINDTDEGEILVRGPNLMKGYYNKPALTQSVLSADGWFSTGDVGKMVEGMFLQITDRKKDIFKTSSGKYIAPMPLQNLFTRSPYIERCMILGFQRPYVTALFVLNFELLEIWCEQHAIHYSSPEYMVHNIKVKEWIETEVNRLNQEIPRHEQVRKFILCPQDWTIENGELTATSKPIRQVLLEHYQKAIDEMYA